MTRHLAARLAAATAAREPTRLLTMKVIAGDRPVTVRLKMESDNRWGSIKDRTAINLVRSVLDGIERPDAVLVESTSGNLGAALAALASAIGRRFVAVVDPTLAPAIERRLYRWGADIDMVSEPDDQGGYLNARLTRVAELCESIPGAVWVDQYHNPANPRAHYRETAPELWRQAADIDSLFVAVSTGGTLAGIGRYFRRWAPHVRVVAVDVPGSRVFGEPTGTRLLTGIGAGRMSTFLRTGDWDDVVLVPDVDAIAMCHEVRRTAGWWLGGSGGAVVEACMRYVAAHRELVAPVCICADGGEAYRETLYNPNWLAHRSIAVDTARLAITERTDSAAAT